jgi:cytoskeleton protein RodZ
MSKADKPLQTPGEILRQAREAAHISAREMADRLHWMPSHIGAIEENRFDELRGVAFVRGYLRTYGKMLGVSEQSLLFAFDAMIMPEQTAESDSTAVSQETLWQRPGVGIAIGIAAAFLLVLLFWWSQDDASLPVVTAVQEAAAPQVDDAGVVTPTELPTQGTDAPAPETDTLEPQEPQLPERGLPEQESEPIELAEEPGADQSAAQLTATPESAVSAADALLQFTFSGECWLEVRDANDALIYANLRQAGDVLRLDGQPPFNVLVGDSHKVLLKYRREDFQIPTRPGRTVARFSVGEDVGSEDNP